MPLANLFPQRETASLPETVGLQPPTDALATPQHGWDRPAGVSYSPHVAQLDSAGNFYFLGWGFESSREGQCSVAQRSEHPAHNGSVDGSNPSAATNSTARASSPVSQPRQGGSGAVEAPQDTSEVRDVDTARAGFPEPRCAMPLSGTVEQKPDALIIANARRLCAFYSLHTAQRGHKATKALRQRLESATQAALAAEVRYG